MVYIQGYHSPHKRMQFFPIRIYRSTINTLTHTKHSENDSLKTKTFIIPAKVVFS